MYEAINQDTKDFTGHVVVKIVELLQEEARKNLLTSLQTAGVRLMIPADQLTSTGAWKRNIAPVVDLLGKDFNAADYRASA